MNDLLQWVLATYGHCIPIHRSLTGPEFAARIRRAYDCGEDPVTQHTLSTRMNKFAASVAESMTGHFIHTRKNICYHPPCITNPAP